MMSLEMASFSLNQGITDEAEADDSISSSSVSTVALSSDSESEEETTSASSSPPSSAAAAGPLQDMSSLMQQLPIKRGLSKFFQGKSQSFTSLSKVSRLEDLAKRENPNNKKLKSCKSYGGLMEGHGSANQLPRTGSSPRFTSKMASSRVPCSSLGLKRSASFLGSRPPIPPSQRSTSTASLSTQTHLFA